MKRLLSALACAFLLSCSDEHSERNNSGDLVAVMDEHNVPGVSIATLEDCEVDEVTQFGTANVDTGEDVIEETVFEAASLTKPLFAFLYMIAVDDGGVELDQPLRETFDYPRTAHDPHYDNLTPRHILTHRSGLPNWGRKDKTTGKPGKLSFKHAPGKKFGYSGEGFQILQAYLTETTGETFEDAFQTHLRDLMPSSEVGPRPTGDVAHAYGHDKKGSTQGGRALQAEAEAGAAWSLTTTARDYARFVAHICAGETLAPETLQEYLQPQSPAPTIGMGSPFKRKVEGISWALGWGVYETGDKRIHFHWGDNGAFRAFVAFDQESGKGVVYFANGENGLELIEAIADPVIGTSLENIRKWL